MDFYKRMEKVCHIIPYGKVATYGQIAMLCGKPRNARQVGTQILLTQIIELHLYAIELKLKSYERVKKESYAPFGRKTFRIWI